MATGKHNRETIVNFKPSFTSVKYFMSLVNYDPIQTKITIPTHLDTLFFVEVEGKCTIHT